ncbi:unnamed protein product [Clonostachys rosea]|uniref:C2H2-type domain-containing protein n=1 Tax=Bionectria ochroleuca TaxID=29856 RepID=A0ABY6UFG6_BIOOC|nr:unnamed protein product [Clonostachys rosea]
MYPCTERGCSRVYKRPEHLSRHRLNHQPRKIHTCSVCHKDFVRLDLMQRHTRRHDRGMIYRNSGGYSNRDVVDGIDKSVLLGGSAAVSSAVELRGQPDLPPDELHLEDIMDSPAPQRVDVGTAGVDASDLDDLLPVRQVQVQQHVAVQPMERLDVEHLSFFDECNDATSLMQDLDWLFDASSWDGSGEVDGINMRSPADAPTTSPASDASMGRDITSHLENTYRLPRERILAALSYLPHEVLVSSFFESKNLEQFMISYWQNYNAHFFLLHQPTFSVQDAPPLLLVALLTLGATLSPDEEHYQVAEKIHQNLRWLIFNSPSFQVPAPLWVIQALLMVQAYEKMFSTRKLHEMSHIFHYSVITLMRRGSCYSEEPEDPGEISSLEKTWYRWVKRELSYRAAFFAFIMDAQHSSIFGHTAALSLNDIQLPLPCADALWNAPTASMWNRERSRVQSSPLFLPALRALLSRHPIPHTYSPFARFVLLHGLFCLTRHMIARDQTASCISVPEQNSSSRATSSSTQEQDNWKERLDRAIDTWSFSLLSQTPSLCLEAARPLQRIAHVSIHVSLVDCHILAGAPNLATGVRTQHGSVQWARAYERVSKWAHHPTVKKPLSHCLLLIQETMFTRARYVAAEDSIILKPWVLYNTTLILWAYGAVVCGARKSSDLGQDHVVDHVAHKWSAEEYLSHMLNGLMGDSGLSQLSGTNRTSGLVTAVRLALEGCRWELLEEARETLQRIATQTLVFPPLTADDIVIDDMDNP